MLTLTVSFPGRHPAGQTGIDLKRKKVIITVAEHSFARRAFANAIQHACTTRIAKKTWRQ